MHEKKDKMLYNKDLSCSRFFRYFVGKLYAFCLKCFRVCSLLPCGHLKGRADLLALVCDVYCDFVSLERTGVVLGCIDP